MIHTRRKHTKYISSILITSLLLTSCTSSKLLRSEYSSDNEQTRLYITKHLNEGDRVKIITTDGRTLDFKVREINSEAIIGEEQQVLFSEIARMEKRQFDAGKSFILVSTIAGGTIVLFYILCFVLFLNMFS